MSAPGAGIAAAIRARADAGAPALVAYLTAGYPTPAAFLGALAQAAGAADVIEVGVPFSDPMADGLSIQRASRVALGQGTTLAGTLAVLGDFTRAAAAPVLLMSYLNPLLNHGLAKLAADAARAGVAGFIVPDLPHEECAEFRAACDGAGLALVQMVTPLTAPARLARLAGDSRGFVYAVTRAGTTGTAVAADDGLRGYLARVRAASALPVCAGFGIRERGQVAALAGIADGVVVGSALVDVLGDGGDVGGFLRGLRGGS